MLLQSHGSPGRRGLKRARSESATLFSQRDAERKRSKGKITVDKDKNNKGKGRVDIQGFRIPDDPEPDPEPAQDDPFLVSSEDRETPGQLEHTNKEVCSNISACYSDHKNHLLQLVNRVTKKVLQSHGILKAHVEYKELLAWIYRGTLFTFVGFLLTA